MCLYINLSNVHLDIFCYHLIISLSLAVRQHNETNLLLLDGSDQCSTHHQSAKILPRSAALLPILEGQNYMKSYPPNVATSWEWLNHYIAISSMVCSKITPFDWNNIRATTVCPIANCRGTQYVYQWSRWLSRSFMIFLSIKYPLYPLVICYITMV